MPVPLTVPGYIDSYLPAAFRRARNLPEDEWVLWFCLHVPVFPERLDGAERIAQYFAGEEAGDRPASTAFCTDADSTVRCIPDDQWGASAKGLNRQGVHCEMTGYANQTRAEWLDDFSVKTMRRTARVFALYHLEYGIPIRFVDAAGLRRGEKGITTHAEAWKAFGGDFRSDPGAHFPMNYFLALCREAVAELGGIMAAYEYCEKGDGVDKVDRPKVRQWQRILRRMGVYVNTDGTPGTLDGIYGETMVQAVAAVTDRDGSEIGNRECHQIIQGWIQSEARAIVKAEGGGGGGPAQLVPHTHAVTGRTGPAIAD